MKELDEWDFPDTVYDMDGYEPVKIPEATSANFLILLVHHNKLVAKVNELSRRVEGEDRE